MHAGCPESLAGLRASICRVSRLSGAGDGGPGGGPSGKVLADVATRVSARDRWRGPERDLREVGLVGRVVGLAVSWGDLLRLIAGGLADRRLPEHDGRLRVGHGRDDP